MYIHLYKKLFDEKEVIYFQQNRATLHFYYEVKYCFSKTFPDKQAGHKDNIECPKHSPELTDFFSHVNILKTKFVLQDPKQLYNSLYKTSH